MALWEFSNYTYCTKVTVVMVIETPTVMHKRGAESRAARSLAPRPVRVNSSHGGLANLRTSELRRMENLRCKALINYEL